MTGPTPFWFIIPLRAKSASKDWARVCRLLRDTVRSALAQSDPNFRVIVACHDLPDLGDIEDDRLIVLQGDFPAPQSLLEQAYDKRAKKRLAAIEIRRQGGGYIMLLDSDDFVSHRLVEYVLQDEERDGYFFPDGYEYFAQDEVIRPVRNFYRLCGSCYIVHYAPEQLPATADEPDTPFDAFKNHRLILETASELGLDLKPVPFPGAVYLRENGENHSASVSSNRRFSRYKAKMLLDRLMRRLGAGRGVPRELVEEFTLPQGRSRR